MEGRCCGRQSPYSPQGALPSGNGASVQFPNSANQGDQHNPTIHFHSGAENGADTLCLALLDCSFMKTLAAYVLSPSKVPVERPLYGGTTASHQQPTPCGSRMSKSLTADPRASIESSCDKTSTNS